MTDEQLQLALYVHRASDLAESVRHNIQHNNGVITPETIAILNAFVTAANQIKDLTETLGSDKMNLN